MHPTPEKKTGPRTGLLPSGAGGELIGAGVLLALGGLSLPLQGSGLDWAMPRVLSFAALGLGAALGLRVLLARRGERGRRSARRHGDSGERTRDMCTFVAAAVVYVVLIPLVGLWLVSLVMVATLSLYLTTRRSPKAAVQSTGAALLVCVLGYAVFTHVLYVPVPANDWVSGTLRSLGL